MNNLRPFAYLLQPCSLKVGTMLFEQNRKNQPNCCIVGSTIIALVKMVDTPHRILLQCTSIISSLHLLNACTLSPYAFLNFQVCACGFVGSKKLPHLFRKTQKNTFAFLPTDLPAFATIARAHGAGCTPFLPPHPHFRLPFTLFSFVVVFPFPSAPVFPSFRSAGFVFVPIAMQRTNSLNTL